MNITRIIPLKEGEEIIDEVRQFFLSHFWALVLSIIFLLVPFFFMFPLFRYGLLGKVIFFVLLLIGLILLIRTIAVWYLNLFVITNQRAIILERRGLFDKSVKEASFDQIGEVSFKQKGISQTLFRYGNIVLVVKGAPEPLTLKNIKSPQRTYQIIVEQQNVYRRNFKVNNEPLNESLEEDQAISKMIEIYGAERVERALRKISVGDGQEAKNPVNTKEALDKEIESFLQNEK